jgi:hypothetical protein
MKRYLLVIPLFLFALLSSPLINHHLALQVPGSPSRGAKISNVLLEEATLTPSPAPALVEEANPTKTQKPTATPVPVPPPPSQGSTNILIFFSLVAVFIVLFGVFINRAIINQRKVG